MPNLTMKMLSLDKQGVLKYMGALREKVDENMLGMLELILYEVRRVVHPRIIFEIYNLSERRDGLYLTEENYRLEGKQISSHLYGCQKVALLGVTLGIEMDMLIRKGYHYSPLEHTLYDCAANLAIEQACDYAEECIAEDDYSEGLFLRPRFSPGFADFPLQEQRNITLLLRSYREIGLSANSEYVLRPSKSITAVVGLCRYPEDDYPDPCEYCLHNEFCILKSRPSRCIMRSLLMKQVLQAMENGEL